MRAGSRGVLKHEDNNLFFVWNMDMVREFAGLLKKAFPPNTLHAYATKANGLWFVMEEYAKEGLGCEAASLGEFCQGLKYFDEKKMVFDSPCKTIKELKLCLSKECLVNLDNMQEVQRVEELIAENPKQVKASIGLRINPQVGSGTMGIFSTGTATSKFGIPLEDDRSAIIELFRKHKWLNTLHVHTGSQGCGLDLMVAGVKTIVELADEIGDQVTIIDIGGGLTVDFTSDTWKPDFQQYADRLREECPNLFKRQIVTEFGRSLLAKTGVLVSRIEYTKTAGGQFIATQHAGVDIAIRTVWAPKDWPLRISCFHPSGDPVTKDEISTNLAGPCCLGGDIIAHERMLPQLSPNDYIVAKDVGGYYHSSYSYYNLRQSPALFTYSEMTDELTMVREGSTVDETLAFMDPKKI